jgi:NodT family efflux transporter outer membrane factor (OMF) lipoprotein
MLPARLIKFMTGAAGLALLAACTVGPEYVRPTPVTVLPAAYKEASGWKVAQPRDEALQEGWWELFNDPQLNGLVEQVAGANQSIQVAEAQLRQARALVQTARAGFFPTATVGASATSSRRSANLGGSQANATGSTSAFQLPVDVAWEADLWGRIRRSVEASQATAQASAADLAAIRLSLQSALAQAYYQLRTLDAQQRLLETTVSYYQMSLELTRNRYAGGIVAKSDLLQAETQLKSTQAQTLDLGVQRAQLEHAIALLIGKPAASFSLAKAPLTTPPPPIPLLLPAELLERRPDIAAAERRVAAANAQIGVTEAAFYPTVKLSATAGFEASSLAKWLTWPSRFWAVGPAIAETVFDGGLRQAQTDQARAAYDATVAAYRQTVLTGFQEVEDNLAALRILAEEAQIQDEAVQAARQAVTITDNQYRAGIVSYLNVLIAQTTELANERTAIDILGRRLAASVLLVKALGGGWQGPP